MGFDGMHADVEFIGNILAAVTGSDTGKHLFFPKGQTGCDRMY
jgi:hypothetical protein